MKTKFKKFRAKCTSCTSCYLRSESQVTQPVLPGGSKASELMIIGEAPGFFEDLYNEPFAGESGDLFRKSLIKLGLKVPYFTNLVKCRTNPETDPSWISIDACSRLLEEEIQLIAPKVILTVGAIASKFFLTKGRFGINLQNFSMNKFRGMSFNGINNIKIIPK